jgi:uncharacterized SAM-binding protein YcdF (DUF218 family)
MNLYIALKNLLMPPGILILMLAGAFLLARGVGARLLIFVAASLLALMSLPAVSVLLMAPLETYPALNADSLPRDAQGIIVMGAGGLPRQPEYGADIADNLSMQRLRYAAFLHRRTGLPVYLTGGTLEPEHEPVGLLMGRAMREELGIPVAGVESASRNSWENAAYSRPMLERDGIGRVLLVTHAWHMGRSVEAFERAGIPVIPAPTGFVHRPGWREDLEWYDWLPDAKALMTSYYAVHEHLGRVWYQIRYWMEGGPAAPDAPAQRGLTLH